MAGVAVMGGNVLPSSAALALVAIAAAHRGGHVGTGRGRGDQRRRHDHLHDGLHRGRRLVQPVPRLPGDLLRGVGARYDFLVGYSMGDMSPGPALAETWDTSEDGLTWTFHMLDGLKWSDGEPLTSADIAYTYNRVLTGRSPAAPGELPQERDQRHRAGRRDRGAAARQAQRDPAADADPDRPRARLDEHHARTSKRFANEPD